MIIESSEWKRSIRQNNAYIRRQLSGAFKHDGILDRIQMRTVSNALYVRRLFETPKVASALKSLHVQVGSHPWAGQPVDYMNYHKIDELYQVNNPIKKGIGGLSLCDQIIHSFVWMWCSSTRVDELIGFIVSSDRKKHSEMYIVEFKDWFEFNNLVANSNPSSVTGQRDPATGQWGFEAK